MSLLKEEVQGPVACSDTLLSQALHAQLAMLQAMLPLQGWLVASAESTKRSVLAGSGIFASRQAVFLDRLLALNPLPTSLSARPYLRQAVSGAQLGLLGEAAHGCAWVMFPLLDANGQSQGVLSGLEGQACPAEEQGLFEHVLRCAQALAAVLVLGKQLGTVNQRVQRVEYKAITDALTGVFNRAGWMAHLSRLDEMAQKQGCDLGLLMLDLDYLKVVNDTRGHAAGDDLLCRAVKAIQTVVRREDYVGRLGGDEFGVAVFAATPQGLAALMQRMSHAMQDAGINISMGMALRSEAADLKQVLHLADQRMYGHKRTKPVPLSLAASLRARSL